jgi:ATP-binding cassette subfamily B protein
MKTFAKVAPILKRNLPILLLGIFVLIIIDGIQLIIPKIIQTTIDKIGVKDITHAAIFQASLLIVGMTLVMTFLRYFWRLFLIGTAWVIDRDMRNDYFQHLMKLSANFFNKTKTGDLMAYATNDLNAIRMLIGFGMVIGVDILILTVGNILFMLNISPKLTLLAILPMPVLSIVIIVLGRKIHSRFRNVQNTFATLSGKVQESISGIRVVKAFAQEDAELEKVSLSAYDYVKQTISLVKIQAIFHPSFMLIIGFSMLMVMVFGGEATILDDISMGEFIAFFQYLGMFIWPMIAIGWVVNMYQQGTVSLRRLNEIFEIQPEIKDEQADASIKTLPGKLEIKDLSFQYQPNLPFIFKDLSISVPQGKTLAVVGKTGSGKTTFLELLTRVYNPPENTIFIDEHEIYKIPLSTLRAHLILVPQDIFLFSATVANNIRLGKPEATFEEVVEVAKNAQVYEEILEFENGFDTIIGERGVTLSGGQKQRLAIARALLINPAVLLLDDALSAVDTKTEKEILNHLIRLRTNKTTIIIAHRISSLQHADNIIVLENSTIQEQGTHEELLAQKGIYAELYEKQQIEERLEEM